MISYTDMIDRFFIFYPNREMSLTPQDVGLAYENVWFTCSDGVSLNGWFVIGETDAPTLVWFHGNGGNISNRVSNIGELNHRLGLNIFIFDYRGYGRSGGSPTESGVYLDAEAAVRYVRSRTDIIQERTVYFGRSLGCSIAARTAAEWPPHALILESPFTSVRAMAKHSYPFLPGISLVTPRKFDCLSAIKQVRVPIMVLHGDQDEVVPLGMGKELYEAARPPKRFYVIPGAGHNDTYVIGGESYYGALESFVRYHY